MRTNKLGKAMIMDFADFLRAEVDRTTYRDVEAKTGVSRGALENLVNRTNKDLPTIETLARVASAYNRPLWEVVQMVVDLELPQTPTELGERLAVIVERHPRLKGMFMRLQALENRRPDLVRQTVGALVAAIEALDQNHIPPPPTLPNPPQE